MKGVLFYMVLFCIVRVELITAVPSLGGCAWHCMLMDTGGSNGDELGRGEIFIRLLF